MIRTGVYPVLIATHKKLQKSETGTLPTITSPICQRDADC